MWHQLPWTNSNYLSGILIIFQFSESQPQFSAVWAALDCAWKHYPSVVCFFQLNSDLPQADRVRNMFQSYKTSHKLCYIHTFYIDTKYSANLSNWRCCTSNINFTIKPKWEINLKSKLEFWNKTSWTLKGALNCIHQANRRDSSNHKVIVAMK